MDCHIVIQVEIIHDGNTHDKPYQLKKDDIDCHVNYHLEFGSQVSVPVLLYYNVLVT